MPEVKPLKLGKELQVLQPRHAPFFKLPRNEIMLSPSGGGKTVAHIRTLIDRDKLGGLFDRYFVFSPNAFVDPQYRALAQYIEAHTGQKKEDCFYDTWQPERILEILEEMKKANAYVRKNKKALNATRLYSCHLTVDDFADLPLASKSNNSPLIQMFTKGRHAQCSTTILTQKFRLLHSAIRVNTHSLWVGRLSSALEVKAVSEEYGHAAGGQDRFEEMLRRATEQDFGFLFLTFGLRTRFFRSYGAEYVAAAPRVQAAEKKKQAVRQTSGEEEEEAI